MKAHEEREGQDRRDRGIIRERQGPKEREVMGSAVLNLNPEGLSLVLQCKAQQVGPLL